MNQISTDEKYMRRCLQLARNGQQNAKPNPMVGAVIVYDGRIIGEGYHIRCGEGHAEVNAFKSVSDADGVLLSKSTMYVSLEPCSHYGRTPPCADLIVSKGIKRVVIGCVDPFAKVQGRGIRKLQDAGIDVTVGVLEKDSLELNKRFITFNTHHRPYIVLKWAQSANDYIDDEFKPTVFSTPFTKMLVHKLRSESDAILVGRVTEEHDRPLLNVREWSGRNPLKIILDRKQPFSPDADFDKPIIPQLMNYLYDIHIQSLLVEGGTKTLQSFIDAGIWDEIRIEMSPKVIAGGTKSPVIPVNLAITNKKIYDGNVITTFRNANTF